MSTSNEEIMYEIYGLQSYVSGCIGDARKLSAHIARGNAGREVSLAITKLQEAQSWLKLALQELAPSNPSGEEDASAAT